MLNRPLTASIFFPATPRAHSTIRRQVECLLGAIVGPRSNLLAARDTSILPELSYSVWIKIRGSTWQDYPRP
jgi:hypothetical protein